MDYMADYRPQEYGTSYAEGYDVIDTVCIAKNPDVCVKKFKWFDVVYEQGMEDIYGIVGMSTGFTSDSGPSFI